MDILKELWHGNICPNEQYTRRDDEYYTAIGRVAAEKELLQKELSPVYMEKIESLLDISMEAESLAQRDAFINGFCLAMRMMAAGLTA